MSHHIENLHTGYLLAKFHYYAFNKQCPRDCLKWSKMDIFSLSSKDCDLDFWSRSLHPMSHHFDDDISAGYRYIPSMHLPEVGARLPLRRENKRPCTQKSTPLGVLTGVIETNKQTELVQTSIKSSAVGISSTQAINVNHFLCKEHKNKMKVSKQ